MVAIDEEARTGFFAFKKHHRGILAMRCLFSKEFT
jgi:hypothetical protein